MKTRRAKFGEFVCGCAFAPRQVRYGGGMLPWAAAWGTIHTAISSKEGPELVEPILCLFFALTPGPARQPNEQWAM